MQHYFLLIFIFISLNGCTSLLGHQGFINQKNNNIGVKINKHKLKPFEFKNTGKLKRANFVITGQGLTHITKDNNKNLIIHWSLQEILPIFSNRGWKSGNKKWIGKCLIYYLVDPKTYIVKGWGFDKGGNPLSCRNWP